MLQKRTSLSLILLAWVWGMIVVPSQPLSQAALSIIQAPVLKWQHAGCYASWCETGWYSSPAVADLNGDGAMEVIAAAYSIFVLDGETGALSWRVASGHDRNEPSASAYQRTWPGVVVADIDADGELEIVTAHSGGYASVYTAEGYFKPGWFQRPITRELRGLSVYDLDNDGTLEIVLTGAVIERVNTWVFEHDGTLRSGWPQLVNDSGYAWGVFNDNAAIADLDGDKQAEIIVPSDVHYICAYDPDGNQLPAHSVYGGKGWGLVGIWESLEIELRGWGRCDGVRAESYRTNFADGASVIADVNGDGIVEVIATGNVYDCHAGYPPSRYTGLYIFNADRSRFNSGGYDWRNVPADMGAPLVEDYDIIESVMPNPVVADLDGDGNLEILFASYDGKVHAFWLDKTEHGNWPFDVYSPSEGFYRFASEPLIADLDGDGLAEVIFSSWVQKGSYHTGKLHILDYLGNPIHEVDLPMAYGSMHWNGAMAAPTLANIDGDPDLEIVINTAHSGVVAYDLPGTSEARVMWGTGRGNFQRSGSILWGNLVGSSKSVHPTSLFPGEQATYTINLKNNGPQLGNVTVTDDLPEGVDYTGNLSASSGVVEYQNGTILWSGDVSSGIPVVISFAVTVDPGIQIARVITNLALIEDSLGNSWQRQAVLTVNGYISFLPMISK